MKTATRTHAGTQGCGTAGELRGRNRSPTVRRARASDVDMGSGRRATSESFAVAAATSDAPAADVTESPRLHAAATLSEVAWRTMGGEAPGAGMTLTELGGNWRDIRLRMPSSLGHLSRLCWPFVNCEETRLFSKPSRGKRCGRQRDVLPLPLAVPSAEDMGIKAARGHCGQQIKRVTTWLLPLVLVVNFEYYLKQFEFDVAILHGTVAVVQDASLTRLIWVTWRFACDGSEPLAQLDWSVEFASQCLSYNDEEIGVGQRVTLDGLLPALLRPGRTRTISAVDIAESDAKACLLEPGRVELMDAEKNERSPYVAVIWGDYDEWVRIAVASVALGVCGTLREADLWMRRGRAVVNGLFGGAKSEADDVETPYGGGRVPQLTMNWVPSNAWLRMSTGDLNEMALARIWQHMILLEAEIIMWNASDRRCFFYIFLLPTVWYKMMVFSVPLPGEILGWEAGSSAYICSRVRALGWLFAVGACQHAHRNRVRRGTALPRGVSWERELRRDRPLPWTEITSSSSLPTAPHKIGLVTTWHWVRVMRGQRACMGLCDHTWRRRSRGFTGGPVRLPGVQELLTAVIMAPPRHTDSRLGLDNDIFGSVADIRGEAVCIGREITTAGHAALERFNIEHDRGTASEQLLLVPWFDGIGGARLTVASLRATPAANVSAKVDTKVRLVVRPCWRLMEELGDVTSVSRGRLLKVRDQCTRPTRDLLIACLTSLHVELLDERGAGRGRVSTLEALRRRYRLLLDVIELLEWTMVREYDGHAELVELAATAKTFEVHIVWFCARAVTWVRRLCWYLISEDSFTTIRDRLCPIDSCHVLIANQVLTSPVEWLEDDCLWSETLDDFRSSTATRRATRTEPPRWITALASFTTAETAAWAKDEGALPQHHYWKEFQVLGHDDVLRPPTGEEHDAVIKAFSSDAKQNVRDTATRRSALLAMTLNCVALGVILRSWAQQCGYMWKEEPLMINDGPRGCDRKLTTSHRGSDVRLTSGEPMRPKAWSKQAVNPDWWLWQHILVTRCGSTARINEHECRNVLLTLRGRCRSTNRLACRWLTLLDSFVAITIVIKKRSSSNGLNRGTRRLATLELATFSMSVFELAGSRLNPADRTTNLMPRYRVVVDAGVRTHTIAKRRRIVRLQDNKIQTKTLRRYRLAVGHFYY